MVNVGDATTSLIKYKLNSDSGAGGMDGECQEGCSSGNKSTCLPVIFQEIKLPKIFWY